MICSIKKQGKERWEIQRKFVNVDMIWVREKKNKQTRLIVLLVKELEFTVTSGS